jgi:hypothetical protein
MLTFGVVLLHDNVRPHTAARTGACQLGVVCPPSLQPRSCSERLPPVYLPKELVEITALQQQEALMGGVKTWLSSQAEELFGTGI